MVRRTKLAIGGLLVRYYLSLRISAAAAIPDYAFDDWHDPAPIIRQVPGRINGVWDEREVIRHGDQTWIITRDQPRELRSTISWN